MKLRVASFLLCVCFCFCSLSLSSSAVDDEAIFNPGSGDFYVPEEFEEPEITEPEEDYSYDEDIFLSDSPYLEMEVPYTFLTTRPNFPDFNPNMVPWSSAPDFIQEIVFNTPFIATSGSSDYPTLWKQPFVLVMTDGNYVRVIVGINLSFATYFLTQESASASAFAPHGNYVICEVLHSNGSVLPGIEYACAYEARYFLETMNVAVDWHALNPSSAGNRISYFTGNLLSLDLPWDYYFYGSNCMHPNTTSNDIFINTGQTAMYPRFKVVGDTSLGFKGSSYIFRPDLYPNAYFSSFTPESFEQQQASTSKNILNGVKGLWESVKQLPDLIGDKIKNLFVPSEGFFSTYITSYQDYFKDRFGLIYEIPDSIVNLLQQFIDFTPAESGYSIAFPEVVLPVLDEEGEWSERTLIQATDIKFDFLEQGAFKTMYSLYRSAIWMFYIFALINLIIRKSRSIFGGYE